MPGTVILWSHALAALAFAVLAILQARATAGALPRRSLVVAFGLTALWALSAAGIDPRDLATRTAESLRNLAWIGFMATLVRRRGASGSARAVLAIHAMIALLVVIGIGIAVAETAFAGTPYEPALAHARVLMRMMVAISALLMLHNLSGTYTAAKGGGRLLLAGLAMLWAIDLASYTASYLADRPLFAVMAARGLAMVLLAPVFAVAVQRGGVFTLTVSRTVAYQTLSVAAIGLYLALLGIAGSAIAALGGGHARLIETAFVFGTSAAVLTLISSPAAKAWAKVKLAKHLFRHRYDYRAEWQRFTDTLGLRQEDAAPLEQRVVQAVADLTSSPAGILLVPEEAGLGFAARWHWDAPLPAGLAIEEALARGLETSGRIVEIDAARADPDGEDAAAVPLWMQAEAGAWALVPLLHFGKLAGAVLLARPPIDRALDWEDLDLLRLAGRQVASVLAEARAQDALAEAERFEEFNRRFAFILHDLKNMVSQLSLVARNAERHAENPEFRADMVATLKDSAGRMNELLARLSQHHVARADAPQAMAVLPVVERVAAQRRAQHPVVCLGPQDATAVADPARLETLLGHLVQNAIEASPADEPVSLSVWPSSASVAIEVVDRGCGMAPGFVRDRLFKPFVSSKPGGFGLGAYEARQLAEAMGGTLTVESQEGQGTRFRVTLPAALATPYEMAA